MIKKLKISLWIGALSLFIGAGVAYAANTYSVDTTVSLSSPSLSLTILAGSSDDGIVVNTGTIVPTLSTGDTFTVNNTSGDFTVSPMTGVSINCLTGQVGQVVITGASSQAYTITPSTTLCTPRGGGGGSYTPPPVTIVVTPAVSATPAVPATQIEGCKPGNLFSTTSGKSCTIPATPAVIAGCDSRTTGFSIVNGQSCAGNTGTMTTTTSYNFGTKTLKNGSKGNAVKELQRFLNDKLHLGLKLDGLLGPKTIAVIKKWQKDNGLVPDGLVGPKTKAMMNSEAQ